MYLPVKIWMLNYFNILHVGKKRLPDYMKKTFLKLLFPKTIQIINQYLIFIL